MFNKGQFRTMDDCPSELKGTIRTFVEIVCKLLLLEFVLVARCQLCLSSRFPFPEKSTKLRMLWMPVDALDARRCSGCWSMRPMTLWLMRALHVLGGECTSGLNSWFSIIWLSLVSEQRAWTRCDLCPRPGGLSIWFGWLSETNTGNRCSRPSWNPESAVTYLYSNKLI